VNGNKMKLKILLIILYLFFRTDIFPCTTAIISGRYTIDGRPLMLKHRDSDFIQNRLMYFSDGKYRYYGLVNSIDIEGKEVWGGCNSTGFAIMNSASYNLKGNDTTKDGDKEGVVMKLALQSCATVDEFEKLLISLPKPLGVEANFGVIDAFGNAAYFETNNFTYKKYDVNDPQTAPNGYIIRTNFSCTNDKGDGFGYIRFATTEELFQEALKKKDFSFRFLIQQVDKSLKHSLSGIDLSTNLPKDENSPRFVHFEDYIPRFTSTSSLVIQGVKQGGSTEMATIWTVLGFQLCSVAVPVFIGGGDILPTVLTADESGNAPLCSYALKLKERCYSSGKDTWKKYINISLLMNKKRTGIMQLLGPVEDKIISETIKKQKLWEQNGFNKEDLLKHYNWIDMFVREQYQKLFGL
jgi:hypothetical protein